MKKFFILLAVITLGLAFCSGCSVFDDYNDGSEKIPDEMWSSRCRTRDGVTGKIVSAKDNEELAAKVMILVAKASEDDKSEGDSYETAMEAPYEGHIICDLEDSKKNEIKFYMLADYGYLGFTNGYLTMTSGSANIPVVITAKKTSGNKYKILYYEEAMDGSYYLDSVDKLFTQKSKEIVLEPSLGARETIEEQMKKYGKRYLKKIGRDAVVSFDYDEVHKNVVDSKNFHKGFHIDEKEIEFEYPYPSGTYETVKGNKRYVYETKCKFTGEYKGELIFTKKEYQGKIINQYKAKFNEDKYKLTKIK